MKRPPKSKYALKRGGEEMAKEAGIICIMCPLACRVTVTIDDEGNIIGTANCQCKRGEEYAVAECQFPGRVLTTTVLTEGSSRRLLPVRTGKPVPKGRLMEVMYSLSRIKVKPPIKIGQIIVFDIKRTGVDVVATDELPA
jgi:CxxC motif-containing protein